MKFLQSLLYEVASTSAAEFVGATVLLLAGHAGGNTPAGAASGENATRGRLARRIGEGEAARHWHRLSAQ